MISAYKFVKSELGKTSYAMFWDFIWILCAYVYVWSYNYLIDG